MDWSKSKSIFIVVFLILNVFLYSLYLNRHTEAQLVEVLGEKTIEAQLQDDHITYGVLPTNIEKASYISATVKNFEEEQIVLQNAQKIVVENKNKLIVTLKDPVKISNLDQEESYRNFLQFQVHEGASYALWKVDQENRKITFFQRLNDRKIYYNINGVLTAYLNDNDEIIRYEQTLLDNIEEYNKEKTLLPPIQVIQALYGKRLLKPDSKITEMKLGYSTLIQLKTQVFVPTWEVRVKTQDDVHEEYFVNAVEGKVIDFQLDHTRVDVVDDALDIKEVNEE